MPPKRKLKTNKRVPQLVADVKDLLQETQNESDRQQKDLDEILSMHEKEASERLFQRLRSLFNEEDLKKTLKQLREEVASDKRSAEENTVPSSSSLQGDSVKEEQPLNPRPSRHRQPRECVPVSNMPPAVNQDTVLYQDTVLRVPGGPRLPHQLAIQTPAGKMVDVPVPRMITPKVDNRGQSVLHPCALGEDEVAFSVGTPVVVQQEPNEYEKILSLPSEDLSPLSRELTSTLRELMRRKMDQ